jgi:hypothetical protein
MDYDPYYLLRVMERDRSMRNGGQCIPIGDLNELSDLRPRRYTCRTRY